MPIAEPKLPHEKMESFESIQPDGASLCSDATDTQALQFDRNSRYYVQC